MFVNFYLDFYTKIFVFILGLIVGSFLNLCIYRIPNGESIVYPHSHCNSCRKRILWYDLIPVFSYFALKRKCRYCGSKISARNVIIELSTALLFLAVYIQYGFGFNFFKYALFIAFLIVIGMIDFDTTDIYFKTTLSGTISGLILIIIGYFVGESSINEIITDLYGAVFAGGFISLIILMTNGMGWGDAEFCFLCGLFLGLKNSILMMGLSFLIAAIGCVILIALRKKSKKDHIPFGPSIVLAAILVCLYGNEIINWYMNMFT